MKARDIIIGLIAILLGVIVFKIFLPWWLIAVVMGLVTVFAVYGWVTKATGLEAVWAKRIFAIAIVIFLISLAISLIDQKWQWLGRAMESRQLYSSFMATDRVDPKYPETLAMTLYQTERMRIETEEQKYKKALEAIQEKLAAGKELSQNDKLWIEAAKKKLPELDKELANIRLSRPNGEMWFKSITAKPMVPKLFWFGIIIGLLGIVMAKFTAKKKLGGLALTIGVLAIFAAITLAFFGSEIQAGIPPTGQKITQPKAAPAAKKLETIIPTNLTLAFGEVIRVELRDVSPRPAYVKWVLEDQYGTPFEPIAWPPGAIARGWRELKGGDRWKDRIFKVSIEFPPGTVVRDMVPKKIRSS